MFADRIAFSGQRPCKFKRNIHRWHQDRKPGQSLQFLFWGKSIQTSRERIKKQLKELWQYSQKIASKEKGDHTPPDFYKIGSKQMKQTIEKIDAALKVAWK